MTAKKGLMNLCEIVDEFGPRKTEMFVRGWDALSKDQRDQMRAWTRLQIARLDREEAEIRRQFELLTDMQEARGPECDEFGPLTSKTTRKNGK